MADEPKVKEAPVEAAPTPEELEEMAKAANLEFFDNERLDRHRAGPKPKQEPPKEPPVDPSTDQGTDVPAEPPQSTPDAPKDEKKDKPKPKVKKPPAPAIALEDEMVDEVAGKVAEKLKREPAPAPATEKPKDPLDGFTGTDRTQLERLEWLSKNSDAYKGRDLVAETKKFWDAEQIYIEQWEKENRGQKFNPNDEDHQVFYARNEPDIPVDDLTHAAIEMRVSAAEKRIQEKAQKETDKRLGDIEAQEAFRQAEPEIRASVYQSVTEMVTRAVPEFEQFLDKDKDGNSFISSETIKKMEDEDPAALEVINHEAEQLQVCVRELDSLLLLGNYMKLDPGKKVRVGKGTVNDVAIYPHAEILEQGDALEEFITSKPREDQVYEGKRFLSRKDYDIKLREIDAQKVSKQEKMSQLDRFTDRYWTVGVDEIRTALIAKYAGKVKKILGLADKRIAHRESKKSKTDTNGNLPKPQEQPKKPTSKAPAATPSSSDLVNTQIPSPSGMSDDAKLVDAAMFS